LFRPIFHLCLPCGALDVSSEQQNESSFVPVCLLIDRSGHATERRSCFHKRCHQTSSVVASHSTGRPDPECKSRDKASTQQLINRPNNPQVEEGIELAAYENIPGAQKINLQEILGAEVPFEVISNLQGQIDGIGRN
jgi:hypothetical protein